ncbi:DUF1178 family protein [Caenispirillum bisanense]|uniref:DUF1178 family protein n=1 Tax=Caenispirillum bisanense TaxID=414052 RepID=UPI0031D404B7
MIRYTLQCSQGHAFDQWFDNMADYDARHADGSLSCPDCGDTAISKALMAPALGAAARTPAMPALPPCAGGGCGGGVCPAMAD